MKYQIINILACYLLGTFLFSGIAYSDNDVHGLIKTVTKQNIELCATLPDTCFSGERIECAIKLMNKSGKKKTFGYSSLNKIFWIEIRNSKGELSPKTRAGESEIRYITEENKYIIKELNSGEQIERVYNLSLFFDLTMPDTYILKIWIVLNQFDPDPKERLELIIDDLKFDVKWK